ncbi:hypothetical protein BJV82DRAFT_617545 [Fennellomyces sp. T-0311]|nr:hypothetical protein BJV82DRAFT_617545 [Fennellomyces sp. T-0311]
MHDTMTFERYLVSDTGKIYSLRRREHLALSEDLDGYMQTSLTCDTDSEQTVRQHIVFRVHSVVIQSFTKRRPENVIISHINGKKHDNSLKNLKYIPPAGKYASPRRKKQNPAKEQESASGKTTFIPVPPVTDETNWKTINALPWTKLSFSQYEVSDMGHVRRKRDLKLLNVLDTPHGYPRVHIRHDQQISGTNVKPFFVSRLVAGVFVDGYTKTHNIVHHLNGNRLDNCAHNLEWVSKSRNSFQRNACPVVASLVDDPEKRKEFPSISKAQSGLSINNLSNSFSTYGYSFTREVNWDGEKKVALIQRISSESDTE